MTSTRRAGLAKSKAPQLVERNAFEFPIYHHLTITSPALVHAVDKDGIHSVFKSGSSGILAAKEARDGSRTLAIADSHNVILHRIEEGMERSYRLEGEEGQMLLLEFSPDSKILYFTTTLFNAVQAYSIAETRLLEPGPLHSSIPTVMAISPSGNVLISASREPPLIFVQNRSMGTQPCLLQPLASPTAATHLSFHPDRPGIFLTAFEDGTLAFYDVNNFTKRSQPAGGYLQSVGGELRIFKALHVVTSKPVTGSVLNHKAVEVPEPNRPASSMSTPCTSVGISGAMFIPGYRSRAITCGSDGKCRLLDFDKDLIIRSWHVRAPATAIAVLASKSGKSPLVAVGRADGRVAVYNISGILLRDFEMPDRPSQRVISLEWIKGAVPKISRTPAQLVEETWIELYQHNGSLRSRKTRSSHYSDYVHSQDPESITYDIDLHEVEEADYGTVHYTPRHDEDAPKHESYEVQETYMDLFSPIKLSRTPERAQASPKRRSTPRQRPRISSTTFSGERRKPSPRTREISTKFSSQLPSQDQAYAPGSMLDDKVLLLPSRPAPPVPPTSDCTTIKPSSLSIRQKDCEGRKAGKPGSFALFAPYLPKPSSIVTSKQTEVKSPVCIDQPVNIAPHQELPSVTSPGQDDIWLTSESEEDTGLSRPSQRNSRRRILGATSEGGKAHRSTKAQQTQNHSNEPKQTLQPGFAQSFQGPVNVDQYLPRRSSLANPSSLPGSPVQRRPIGQRPIYQMSTDVQSQEACYEHDEANCMCCLRTQDEIAMLRREVAELRRALNDYDHERRL